MVSAVLHIKPRVRENPDYRRPVEGNENAILRMPEKEQWH